MNKKVGEYTSKVPRRAINMEDMLLAPSVHKPEPFENRMQLYLMHFFFSFVSNMWDIGIIILVAQLTNNSLFLVAIIGLCSSLAIFLFMGIIGHVLDRTNRIVALRIALVVKVVAVSLAYSICGYLSAVSGHPAVAYQNILHDSFSRTLLYSLPALAAIVGMTCCAILQSIEKDWIVVLSANDTRWLSGTNSVMTQIDLACSSLAPALTGVMFAFQSHEVVAFILLGLNMVSALVMYAFMSHLYHSWPALGRKIGVDVLEATDNLNCADLESLMDSDDDDLTDTPAAYGSIGQSSSTRRGGDSKKDGKSRLSVRSAAEQKALQMRRMSNNALLINTTVAIFTPTTVSEQIRAFFASIVTAFHDFCYSGCAGLMVAYAFLYMTVLSFGSLMTVYLLYSGVKEDLVGLFRGLAALFGFFGAVIFPACSDYLGLYLTAQGAILYQFLLVALAASCFFWQEAGKGRGVSVYVVIFAVLFSRTGLWLFDLCVRQIAQETVPEAVRGKINGQWRSMIAFFEMSSFAIAVAVPAPQDFWILATVSAVMVGLALLLFTLTNPYSLCSLWKMNNKEEEERYDNSLYLSGRGVVNNNSVQFPSVSAGSADRSSSQRQQQQPLTPTQALSDKTAHTPTYTTNLSTSNNANANRFSISSNTTSPFHSANSSPVNISTAYHTNYSNNNNNHNNYNSILNSNSNNSTGSKSSSKDNSEEEFVLIPNKDKRATARTLVQEETWTSEL